MTFNGGSINKKIIITRNYRGSVCARLINHVKLIKVEEILQRTTWNIYVFIYL